MRGVGYNGFNCLNNDGTSRHILNVETEETCSQLCLWDSECEYYTYYSNGACYFLNTITFTHIDKNAISGPGC
eukprot:Awhi_evm1s12560